MKVKDDYYLRKRSFRKDYFTTALPSAKAQEKVKMQSPVIAVYDKKTGLFDPPFVVRHNGEAIREWDIVRKDEKTKFGKNPEDFDLFQIATYDDTTGTLSTLQPHTHLASGV